MNQTPDWLVITTGVLVLIIGFVFHWLGQMISVLNWDLATRLGLQERTMISEHKAYEHGTAVADVLIGWVYGFAGVGLLLGSTWGFKLAWIPGATFLYHGLITWFTEGNRRKSGLRYFSNLSRTLWCLGNVATGLLCLYVAWRSC